MLSLKPIINLLALSLLFQSVTAQDWANLNRYKNANRQIDQPSATESRVVFMGNSITEGWQKLDPALFKDKPYINRGISGQTSPQMLLRFRSDVINLNPAVVVILAGTNDIAENTGPISLRQILGNIISMVELAQANEIKVVLASVLPAKAFPWRSELEPGDKIILLNKMIQDFAALYQIGYLDFYTSMVDDDKGLKKIFSVDGVHPNKAGYALMEKLVEPAIHKVLSQP
ncbi:acylhydrolase [bacterium]|nr:acylhydrolase [bacterium]